MLKTLKMFGLAFFTLSIVACSPTSTSESTGEYLDSSAVTAKVKTRLLENLGSDSLAIKVKTYRGEVQLSGFVNNSVIKKRAGSIAMGTIDVKRVRNNLIVK